jgi:ADP-L-glycero-D-manno-heptose 6-epimerase
MAKTALVTGATGFIGYHLCEKLYSKGYQVFAIGANGENKPKCHKLFLSPEYKVPWEKLPDIDICFHQGANNDTTDHNYNAMIHANVNVPSNVFYKLFFEKKCKNFVYASSCSVYGQQPAPYFEKKTRMKPLNPYAESKMLFDMFAHTFHANYGVKIIGLRYTNVYGPNEKHKGKRASMIHQIIEQANKNKKINLFKSGEQKRDWVFIEDVVQANILASKAKKSGVYNIGCGVSISFNNVIDLVGKKLKKKIEVNYVDCPFIDAYQSYTAVNLKESRMALGYKPQWTLEKALKKMT